MSGEDSKAIMHRFLEALSQRNPTTAFEMLTPNVVAHVAGMPGAIQGRDAWKHLFSAYLDAFPDMEITIHDEIAQGETAMARWSWSGTHQGSFMGIPSTGKAVAGISGMGVYRIAEGSIAEEWVIEDTLGLMQQLGVTPRSEDTAG